MTDLKKVLTLSVLTECAGFNVWQDITFSENYTSWLWFGNTDKLYLAQHMNHTIRQEKPGLSSVSAE